MGITAMLANEKQALNFLLGEIPVTYSRLSGLLDETNGITVNPSPL